METAATDAGEVGLGDVQIFTSREVLENGDYPILELIEVNDGTNDFGRYTYFHVKVIKSVGEGAAPAGAERKFSIQRDATGKKGLAKARTLASLLNVLASDLKPEERESYLTGLKGGTGKGSRFGCSLTSAKVEGTKFYAKNYAFRAAEG